MSSLQILAVLFSVFPVFSRLVRNTTAVYLHGAEGSRGSHGNVGRNVHCSSVSHITKGWLMGPKECLLYFKVNQLCLNCLNLLSLCCNLNSTSLIFLPTWYRSWHLALFIFFISVFPIFCSLLCSWRCRVIWLVLLCHKWGGEGSDPQSRIQVKNYTPLSLHPHSNHIAGAYLQYKSCFHTWACATHCKRLSGMQKVCLFCLFLFCCLFIFMFENINFVVVVVFIWWVWSFSIWGAC